MVSFEHKLEIHKRKDPDVYDGHPDLKRSYARYPDANITKKSPRDFEKSLSDFKCLGLGRKTLIDFHRGRKINPRLSTETFQKSPIRQIQGLKILFGVSNLGCEHPSRKSKNHEKVSEKLFYLQKLVVQ